jgi:hypothetical protein
MRYVDMLPQFLHVAYYGKCNSMLVCAPPVTTFLIAFVQTYTLHALFTLPTLPDPSTAFPVR